MAEAMPNMIIPARKINFLVKNLLSQITFTPLENKNQSSKFLMTTGYHFFHLGPIALRRRLSTVLPFTLLFKTKSQLSINFLMTTGYHFFI